MMYLNQNNTSVRRSVVIMCALRDYFECLCERGRKKEAINYDFPSRG